MTHLQRIPAIRPKQTRLSHIFGGKLKFATVKNLPAQISKGGHLILRSNSIIVAESRWRCKMIKFGVNFRGINIYVKLKILKNILI
jgi:hypothetical protein